MSMMLEPGAHTSAAVDAVAAVAGPSISPLPVQLTGFIGRERELEQVARRLDLARLLTLTGAAGSGKTRLALEVARRRIEEHCASVAWVELAAVTDPALVPQAVAAALGVREQAGLSLLEGLTYALNSRALLLVLDNCEHLVEASARLADTLLRAAPALRILATSREALGVAGETAWLVPTLSLPAAGARRDIARLAGSEAVRLFVERARSALPGFELSEQNAESVARVCERLDGLPLALELAAARVRVLTPEQIAERLDDCFRVLGAGSRTAIPRHQTLRAAIDWSYELLSGRERLLLQRLSVFSGGWTIEAAEAVCEGGEIPREEILDLLAALVDRSLVVMQESAGEARYRMLEAVRQYAVGRLREGDDEQEVRRRHARFFLALAEQCDADITAGRPEPSRTRVETEHDNIRGALEWSRSATAESELHARLAGAMLWFWVFEVHWSEGRRWFEDALAVRAAAEGDPLHARLLHGAGVLSWLLGDHVHARGRLRESESLYRALGDERRLAYVLAILATVTQFQQEHPAAVAIATEAVALARRAGTRWDVAAALTTGLGYVHHAQRIFALADPFYEEAESVWREIEHPWGLSLVLQARAVMAWQAGELERAVHFSRAGIEQIRHTGDRWAGARSLFSVAAVMLQQGDASRAVRLLGAAEALRESVGAQVLVFERPTYARVEEAARALLGGDAFAAAWAEGRGMSFSRALDHAATAPEATPPAVAEPTSAEAATVHLPAIHLAAPAAPELRICALGPVRLFRAGDSVAAGEWNSAKPRELLCYLLTYPGRTKDQVGLALWPESSPAQVRNSFHVTLYRLRKTLGRPEWIVAEGDRYSFDRALSYAYDVEQFTEKLRAARTLMRKAPEAAARAAELLEEALALYGGDFLQEEVAGDWCLEPQDELRALYLDGLQTLGDIRFAEGMYEPAAEAYRRVLLREDLREDVHRALIRCLVRLGQRNQALRHFESLVELLREELDAEPEGETRALIERVRQGSPV